MAPELLEAFDKLVQRRGYPSRSEAIRGIVRAELVGDERADGVILATVLCWLP